MSRSLDVLTQIYKPFRITRINKCILFNSMEGNYIVKQNPQINYHELYNYLYTRNFKYLPALIDDSREDVIVLEYQVDIYLDKNQKGEDLIKIVALLHSKTSYFKNITKDTYKEIYDNLKNNIIFIDNHYSELYDKYLQEQYTEPSHYLFLRNYSLIYNACKYCLTKLEEWFNLVSTKEQQRVALVHNNLKLEHFIKNEDDYIISWDHYTIDNPVIDLYNFYKNEWNNLPFSDIFQIYNNNFELLEEEKILLDILISIPYKIDNIDNMLSECREIRRLINYLGNSSKIVINS